ncbi:MAG: flagellar assembly peptidoglycan hydrolase FlgJ [Burkholderiaceae bacterium]
MTAGVGNAGLAADGRGVDALRATAARDPKAAIKEAAKQFEGLFMRELMKSMRQATQSSGLLDNSTTELGTEMLDTQFAQQMTGLRGGLSEAIARHLERQMGIAPGATDDAAGSEAGPAAPASATPVPAAPAPLRGNAPTLVPLPDLSATQIGFVQQHAQAARDAQQQSGGIPASFMLAQAAHETGWGQHPIRHADGRSAHNLFGIKAGAGWKGEVAEITTTEVIDGHAHKVKAKFRAYASDAESFKDYARLIGDSPRYSRALAQSGSAQGFAQELQRAGYATDPHYADKLTRTINTTLRVQRAVG